MQPLKYLHSWLVQNADSEHYLFRFQDLRALFPDSSLGAFKTLLTRAADAGNLVRACRGVYVYKKAVPKDGLILFHIAALLRVEEFNYISLETVLSDAGIISQIPINSISIMSSGRSHKISCEEFGSIEFVHTNQKPNKILKQLTYDINCKLWRANVALALRDMKSTHRNTDLIDLEVAHEFI